MGKWNGINISCLCPASDFHKMWERLISLGHLLLCPILLSCARRSQITGRPWQMLQSPVVSFWNGAKNDTITTTQVSAVLFSVSMSWLGGKPLGCSWDWPWMPTTPHQFSLTVLWGKFASIKPQLWFVVISGFLTAHLIYQRVWVFFIYINTQTKQAMGLCLYIYIYIKILFICIYI